MGRRIELERRRVRAAEPRLHVYGPPTLLRGPATDGAYIPSFLAQRTSVHEDLDHTSEGRRSLGHRAASAIAVRLTDLDLIGCLVTRGTTELDARVDGPQWQIAAENPIRLEAARQAGADGQRKAQASAEGVGARRGALIRLAEPESATFPGAPARSSPFRRIGRVLVEPGEQDITATIEVTFALIAESRRAS